MFFEYILNLHEQAFNKNLQMPNTQGFTFSTEKLGSFIPVLQGSYITRLGHDFVKYESTFN
jgi:hypothetical protein